MGRGGVSAIPIKKDPKAGIGVTGVNGVLRFVSNITVSKSFANVINTFDQGDRRGGGMGYLSFDIKGRSIVIPNVMSTLPAGARVGFLARGW
jgi:hypothetical protein